MTNSPVDLIAGHFYQVTYIKDGITKNCTFQDVRLDKNFCVIQFKTVSNIDDDSYDFTINTDYLKFYRILPA
jgi:hypothetical protein